MRTALRRFATVLGTAALLVLAAAPVLAEPRGARDGRDGRDGGSLWHDRTHGHQRSYPVPGVRARVLPRAAHVWVYGGVPYHFYDGVWYTGGPSGYVVVRPPVGIVIGGRLPPFATVLTIAGITYLYANGVYYRELPAGGGYEVVAPPVDAGTPVRSYVYPRQGQDARRQASDEYECHRWAVQQTGFDPSGAAVGQASAPTRGQAPDYERARTACLEGRGYTVR